MKSITCAFTLVLALGMCVTPFSSSAGADPVVMGRPVPTHRFLDGKNVAMLSISALIMAADLASTKKALTVPGTYEANPLAQSQGAQLSFKIAGVGAGLGLAYLLHRSGHHRAERFLPLIVGVPSGVAAMHNNGIHH